MTEALHEPLEAPAVRETVEELYGRIEARFPNRGLLGVCRDLAMLVDEVQSSAGAGQRRIRIARVVSRVVMVLVLAITLVALVMAVHDAVFGDNVKNSIDVLGLAETAISDLVYAVDRDLLPLVVPRAAPAQPAAQPAAPAPVDRPRHRHAPADQGPRAAQAQLRADARRARSST